MKKLKRKGFISIEIMVGLGIISLITVQGLMMRDEFNKTRLARNVGEHIRQIGEASNKYVNEFYGEIDKFVKGEYTTKDANGNKVKVPYTKEIAQKESGVSNLFDGLHCVQNKCTISINELRNVGMLNRNTANTKNPFGADYNIEFNVSYLDQAKDVPIINGLVVTNKPWTKNGLPNGAINYAMLGEAVHQAGVDSGFTNLNKGQPNAQSIKGYKEGWELDSSEFSNINNKGALAYRFGFHSGDMLAFLRRDGSLPMTGDLNMGGNDIYFNRGVSPAGIFNEGDTTIIRNPNGNALEINPDEVAAEKWLCAKNELSHKICMGGDATSDRNGGNFQIKYDSGRPLLVHNTRFTGENGSTIKADGKDYVVFRIGGSGAVHDNLYVGDKTNDENDIHGKPQVDNNAIKELSGKAGGNVISNYNINHGNAVLRDGSTPADLNNYNDANRYSPEPTNPVAVEINKDGSVIANTFFIKDVPYTGTDPNLQGGLSINQVIPSYSSRGAFVVYDEDLIQKPDCSWHQAPSEEAKAMAKKGRPKVILSWGNIHSSGDEVDQSDSGLTTNDAVDSAEKYLRKHRVILKAEDLDPTAENDQDSYWRAIVKTRSFDGTKWVSAGQAVAHIYCQYY